MLAARIRNPVLDGLAGLRITRLHRHDLGRGRVVSDDHRGRSRHDLRAVKAAVGIGTRGTEHGAADQGERRCQSAAAVRLRRIVVNLLKAGIEGCLLVGIAAALVSVLVVPVVRLVMGPGMGVLSVRPVVGRRALGRLMLVAPLVEARVMPRLRMAGLGIGRRKILLEPVMLAARVIALQAARAMRAVMSVAAFPISICPQAISYLRPSSEVDLVRPVMACLVEV